MNRFADGALVLLAIAAAFWLGSLQGRALGGADQQLAAEQRERDVSAQHAAALRAADTRLRRVEADLRTSSSTATDALKRALHDEKTQHDRLVAELRAGAVRLSVPIVATGGAACIADAARSAGTAGGDRNETRAELAPAAAEDLAAIATDGNAAIVQLNACIDRYNEVRQRLNALREEMARAQAQ
ncbi:lysis system i-spanin subunit Rz [Mitsuaria sp. GD03876]|uniref:lysis system i-spanin subunit Rz n=1 Tax=Mitsuaria sp. GD03876 TaxID=2975399 RepID=UPI00244AF686|nr:lysis system i-spanin subunit Rz [Mitsuaria sp. GD03876]MDH0866447.1 lysis system i-spanin subunit Rz [Mitsuaria sp. GD03876]